MKKVNHKQYTINYLALAFAIPFVGMLVVMLKILAHPVFQNLGLAYIDDFALGILHDVDTGIIW